MMLIRLIIFFIGSTAYTSYADSFDISVNVIENARIDAIEELDFFLNNTAINTTVLDQSQLSSIETALDTLRGVKLVATSPSYLASDSTIQDFNDLPDQYRALTGCPRDAFRRDSAIAFIHRYRANVIYLCTSFFKKEPPFAFNQQDYYKENFKLMRTDALIHEALHLAGIDSEYTVSYITMMVFFANQKIPPTQYNGYFQSIPELRQQYYQALIEYSNEDPLEISDMLAVPPYIFRYVNKSDIILKSHSLNSVSDFLIDLCQTYVSRNSLSTTPREYFRNKDTDSLNFSVTETTPGRIYFEFIDENFHLHLNCQHPEEFKPTKYILEAFLKND